MRSPIPLHYAGMLTAILLLVFALTALLATTLRQIGAPLEYAGYLAFVFVAGTFVFTGLFGKTMRMAHFAQADRAGNSSYTGQALATGSIAGMTYVLLAGEIYANGLDGVAWISGTVIGFAVLSFVIAPPFAGRNHQSVAGLVGHRNAPTFVNLLAALIILLISVPLLIAQLQLTSMIAEGYLNLPGPTAVITGAGVITICLILGGMQSLTISRIIFYPIIAVCFLTPLIWISLANGGGPIPQLGYGLGALSTISEIDAELLTEGIIEADEIFSLATGNGQLDAFNFISLVLCLGGAFAVMPHLVQHLSTVDHRNKARRSGVWGLFLVLLILTAVPAAAAFAKVEIYTQLLGLPVMELEDHAEWIFQLSGGGSSHLIKICNVMVQDIQTLIAACGADDPDRVLLPSDIELDPERLILGLPLLAQLPELLTVLVAMGAIAAVWTTADGLVFTSAQALSHDGYFRSFKPEAPIGVRLFVTRLCMVIVAVLAAYLALTMSHTPRLLIEFAIAIAAGSLFPTAITRLWRPEIRATVLSLGAAAGLIITLLLFGLTALGADLTPASGDEMALAIPLLTSGLQPVNAGLLGMLTAFAIVWGVTWIAARRRG